MRILTEENNKSIAKNMNFSFENPYSFKERLKSFTPLKSLPAERELYFSKRKRFIRRLLIVTVVIFSLIPLLFMILGLDFKVVRNMDSQYYYTLFIFWFYACAVFSPLLIGSYYLVRSATQTTTKAQRMLLEQMSEKDWHFFNEIRNRSLTYAPPFILCQEKLYLFKFNTIVEISLETIEKMEILLKHRGKNITIGIWHPEKTTLFINRSLYPYLETLVGKYKVKL